MPSHDMLGNVWEWVQETSFSDGIIRGGSWRDAARGLGIRSENRLLQFRGRDDVGFRLARDE